MCKFRTPSDGARRVTLTHTGWERMEDGAQMREGYSVGWENIIERIFADYAA